MHVLIITFPGYGHIVPMLELARKIADHHQVTFVVSRSKFDEISQKDVYIETDNKRIRLFALEDDINMEQCSGLPVEEAYAYMFDRSISAVRHLLLSVPTPSVPNCCLDLSEPVGVVVVNILLGGALSVCAKRGIPYYIFCPGSSDFVRYLLALNEDTPTMDHVGPFRDAVDSNGKVQVTGKFFKKHFAPLKAAFSDCKGIIVNSTRDLEKRTIDQCEQNPLLAGVPFYCIGPLLGAEDDKTDRVETASSDCLKDWLNRNKNVVFISFGSVASLPPAQIEQIATALLELDQPFVWSLKQTHHGALPEELLSTGTIGNFDGKGVILPWVDQKLILRHPSVEVFVSHCGWNSTLEGLSGGKPMVCWPMFGDQLVNAELVTSTGAGTSVVRDGGCQGQILPAAKIVEAVKTTMRNGTDAARRCGREIETALQPGGTSVEELRELIAFREKQ